MRPRPLLPLLAAALGLVAMSGVRASDATFISTSTYGVSVSAAADWAPPTVSVTDPGATISGIATISATTADTGTGVANVVIQYAVANSGTWTTLCTDTTAPYSCMWTTTGVADGSYDLRAIATDNAAFTATSSTVTTRVVNNLQVVLSPVPSPTRGQITLKGDVGPSPGVPMRIYFEYVVAGASGWEAVPGCGDNGALVTTRTCTWDSSITGSFDIRAVATNGVTTMYGYQRAVTIDNTPPTTTLTVPSGTLAGTVQLSATASDANAGMDTVAFQYRGSGATNFITACTVAGPTYACSLNTTSFSDGSYDFRAVGTDRAGNITTTPIQTRAVNNTVSSVAITSPSAGAMVRGTVNVTAAATSNRGINKVVLERRVTGTSAWTPLCTASTSPYSCPWNTAPLADGSYDLHAVLTDGAGTVTTSATVAVTVDNSLRGQDIQATNVTTLGTPASNDQLTFTYSNTVDYASILPGWIGSSTNLTVTFNDASFGGGPVPGQDYATFGTVNLGWVAFAQDYVKSSKAVAFNATMSAVTQTIGGVPVTVVTVTLGSVANGGSFINGSSATGTMTWAPSTAAKTSGGVACSATAATESGALDRDL